jgi:uncharacterized protein (DUF362 family)
VTHPEDPHAIDRRQFLKRSTKAGIAIAGASLLGYALYDPKGPGGSEEGLGGLVRLPSFAMAEGGHQMAIATGADRVNSINLALKALGGIESFIKQGDRVLIKVNAAFASPPFLCATTNPELLAEVCRLCFKAGASSVVVTDNPINNPESCFALSGMGEAARSVGAGVILPKDTFFRPTTVPGGSLIRNWPVLYTPFEGVNKLIGIAPVKDHHRSGASMSMKNWYGLIGGRRNTFHQNINDFIKELGLMVRPTLVILDGTMTMMTNGPTGGSLSDLKATNTMIVSTDQVAADAFGATLLGQTAMDLPFLQKAEAAGVGTVDYESLRPIRVSAG